MGATFRILAVCLAFGHSGMGPTAAAFLDELTCSGDCGDEAAGGCTDCELGCECPCCPRGVVSVRPATMSLGLGVAQLWEHRGSADPVTTHVGGDIFHPPRG